MSIRHLFLISSSTTTTSSSFTNPIFSFPRRPHVTMSLASGSSSSSPATFRVPDMNADEMDMVVDQTFKRYTNATLKRNVAAAGVSIVWFRNDLRVLDNEALLRAWTSSEYILPVYCFDPRIFGSTHYFGFPKTGALRAQFLTESVADLKKNLIRCGLNLLIRHGKSEEIIPSLTKEFGVHTVYAHKETCSEEVSVERLIAKALKRVVLPSNGSRNSKTPTLQLVWGSTMYHIDDLPFSTGSLPDVYTQFRKSVESKCTVRSCFKLPTSFGPLATRNVDEFGGWGSVPTLEELSIKEHKTEKGLCFLGGESAALGRIDEYFWKKDLLRIYKETRNGMLGADYSTKFSPWLAFGTLSPRYVYEEVRRYEKERQANDSTYWVLFELIWRDYFRFLSLKYGNSIFHPGGPRKLNGLSWSQDQNFFELWRNGCTGYPLIDANMKELYATGFMSNRGRQIVCSFLVRDMGIDWRMGAEWFETCLLDYDPCSNYGNWTYGAGVGNDPREDRYFSIPKQAQTYDPDGEFVAYWLPELKALPKEKRHFPGTSYIKQVVPLKFGFSNSQRSGRGKTGTWKKNNYRT